MGKYVLPFELDVEIKTFQRQSFPLGIIKATVKDYDIWLCNKFINCSSNDTGAYCVYEKDLWSIDDGLTIQQNMCMLPEFFAFNNINLININKEMLQNNFYILGRYNEYYIPGKACYSKRNFDHDYIIFGYDDEQMVFKSAGYLADGRYQFFDIGYKEYYNSVIHNKVKCIPMDYYKIDNSYKPQINIPLITKTLNDFLCSYNETPDSENEFFGLNAAEKYYLYIKYFDNGHLDIRLGRSYMEHKYIMYKRLVCLYQNSFASCERLSEEYYEAIVQKANVAYMLCLKYAITKNPQLLTHVAELIYEINVGEKIIIERLLEVL